MRKCKYFCKIRVIFLCCVQYLYHFDDELFGGNNCFFQKTNWHSLHTCGEHEGGHRNLFFESLVIGISAFALSLSGILGISYVMNRFDANPHNLRIGKYSSNYAVGKEKPI